MTVKITQQMIDAIVESYNKSHSSHKVAKELRISKRTAIKYLQEAGILLERRNKHTNTIITDIQSAWLAGFIDGEGNFGFVIINKGNGYRCCQPRLVVANAHKESIELIKQLAGGGTIACRKLSKKNKKWSDCYTVTITGHSLTHIINHIKPFCIVKSEHVKLYEQFILEPHKSYSIRLMYKERFELLARNGFKQRYHNSPDLVI